jgi:hypothetical protein
MPTEDLRQSPMMSHMLNALERGEDIGHYGRLTLAMIARYFVDNEELARLLAQDASTDENEARQDPGVAKRTGLPNLPKPRRSGCLQRLQRAPLPRRGLRGYPGVPRGKS